MVKVPRKLILSEPVFFLCAIMTACTTHFVYAMSHVAQTDVCVTDINVRQLMT